MRKTSRLLAPTVPLALAVIVALAAPAHADPAASCNRDPTAVSSECGASSSATGLKSAVAARTGQATADRGTAAGQGNQASDSDSNATGQAGRASGTGSTEPAQGQIASRRVPRATQCRCPRALPEEP